MAKSPAHWQQPASDKASAAAEEKQLKVGNADLKKPSDGDWHYAAKVQGRGFACNPVDVLVRGDNRAALKTRSVPVHDYKLTDTGAGTGEARVEIHNRLAAKRK